MAETPRARAVTLLRALESLKRWRDFIIQTDHDANANLDRAPGESFSLMLCLRNPFRPGEPHEHVVLTPEFMDVCVEALEELIMKETTRVPM